MKRFLILILLLAPGAARAQVVSCPNLQKTCLRSEEIHRIASTLPALEGWTIIPVPDRLMWISVCTEHRVKCDVWAFTELRSQRTYLNVTAIWNQSAEAGIKTYLKHELGHIYTNSVREKDADRWARDH